MSFVQPPTAVAGQTGEITALNQTYTDLGILYVGHLIDNGSIVTASGALSMGKLQRIDSSGGALTLTAPTLLADDNRFGFKCSSTSTNSYTITYPNVAGTTVTLVLPAGSNDVAKVFRQKGSGYYIDQSEVPDSVLNARYLGVTGGTATGAINARVLDKGGAGWNVQHPSFGAVGDARAVTVSISGTAITGTGFTSADNGKTIVIANAGAPLCTPTLSTTLSTASAITSLPVSVLATNMPPGDITITQSGNTQVFQTTALTYAGATSIPVVAMIPTFAFTSAATVKSPITSFKTTVTYVSATSLTAAASPTTNVTSQPAVLGTDDTAAFQAAITAAYSSNVLIVPKPLGPIGYAYLITSSLNLAHGDITIRGGTPGVQIWFSGAGSLFENGTDDLGVYDANDYSGIQFQRLEHLTINAVPAGTTLGNGLNVYSPGSIGFRDWRGGNIQEDNVTWQYFDFPFWGIQSDINSWKDVQVNCAHSGIYAGPRSDQFSIVNLYALYCDRILDLDRTANTRLVNPIIVDCGNPSTNPVRVRCGAWSTSPVVGSRGIVFENPWFEQLIGSNVIEAWIEVGVSNGVADATQSFGISILRPFVEDNTLGSGINTKYLVKSGNVANITVDDPSGDGMTYLSGVYEFVGSTSPSCRYICAYQYRTSPVPYVNNGTGTPYVFQSIYGYNIATGLAGMTTYGSLAADQVTIVGNRTGAASANAYLQIDSGSNSSNGKGIRLVTSNTVRWAIGTNMYGGSAESGSNTGSNLQVNCYTDAGAILYSNVLAITRASGVLSSGRGRADALVSQTLASAGALTVDCSAGNVQNVLLQANATSFAFSNATAGQIITLKITQDGTGSRGYSLGSSIKWVGGTVPTPSTTAGYRDIYTFVYDGTEFCCTASAIGVH